jgi:hypothetical protein
LNILIEEFGDETADWVGKEVTVRSKKDVVGGRKVEIFYFVTPNWDFDEYREITKMDDNTPPPEDDTDDGFEGEYVG